MVLKCVVIGPLDLLLTFYTLDKIIQEAIMCLSPQYFHSPSQRTSNCIKCVSYRMQMACSMLMWSLTNQFPQKEQMSSLEKRNAQITPVWTLSCRKLRMLRSHKRTKFMLFM